MLPPSEGFLPCPGWLNFLPDLFQRCNENSALSQAVFAAAYANIAQKSANRKFSIEAVSYYLKALKLVSSTLSESQVASGDGTMTAVLVLGIYEVC